MNMDNSFPIFLLEIKYLHRKEEEACSIIWIKESLQWFNTQFKCLFICPDIVIDSKVQYIQSWSAIRSLKKRIFLKKVNWSKLWKKLIFVYGAVHILCHTDRGEPNYGRERGWVQLILMYDNDNGGRLKNLRVMAICN